MTVDDIDRCSGSDRIVLTDGSGIEIATLCDSSDTNSYETTTGQFKITFTTDSHSGTYKGFQAIYNLYYFSDYSCFTYNDDFKCENEWCIPESLHCDGTKHCSDNTDEVDCSSDTSATTIIIVVVVVFTVTVLAIPVLGAIASAVQNGCAKKSSTSPSSTTSPARSRTARQPADDVPVSATPAYMQRPIDEFGGTYDPAYPTPGLPPENSRNPTNFGPENPYTPTYPTTN
ncbi:uncharacterized protein LOC144438039 [Glandiceps talaboti]